jgi:CheY-like chemotaxis protein
MGARILVADDSVTIQKVVELTFSREDFVLVQARSGEETIRKAKEVRPDLILLDLVMPDKNGYEVCATLRAEPTLRAVPIILLAGTFEAFDKEQGLRAGANDVVTKPFESQALISKVKQLLFVRMVEKGAPASRPGAWGGQEGPNVAPPAPVAAGSVAAPFSLPSQVAREEAPPDAAAQPEASASWAGARRPPPEARFDLPPSTEEIAQDRLWQLLDASAPPPASGEAAGPELSLEALTESTTPTRAEEAQPDIPLLELDAAGPSATEDERAHTGPVLEPGVGSLPESLSLEDLLLTPPPPPATDVAPLMEDDSASPPIFDLTAQMEAPPLYMSEAAEGESAGIAFTDLLHESPPAEPAPAPAAELDLVPLSQAVSVEAFPSGDLPAAETLVGAPEAPEAPSGIPLTPDEGALIEAAGPAGVEASPSPAAAPGGDVEEFPLWEESATALPVAEELQTAPLPDVESIAVPSAAPDVSEADVVSIRDAVAERVARELARDLTEKLVERIERIVWEVVPDLAEILITKEIERIRAMAQDKKSS